MDMLGVSILPLIPRFLFLIFFFAILFRHCITILIDIGYK